MGIFHMQIKVKQFTQFIILSFMQFRWAQVMLSLIGQWHRLGYFRYVRAHDREIRCQSISFLSHLLDFLKSLRNYCSEKSQYHKDKIKISAFFYSFKFSPESLD